MAHCVCGHHKSYHETREFRACTIHNCDCEEFNDEDDVLPCAPCAGKGCDACDGRGWKRTDDEVTA